MLQQLLIVVNNANQMLVITITTGYNNISGVDKNEKLKITKGKKTAEPAKAG